MNATDKTILIQCSECPGEHFEEGLADMIAHIKEDHPNYTRQEAEIYAQKWMEAAYVREEKFLASYYEDRKLEKSIEATREFQRHKI